MKQKDIGMLVIGAAALLLLTRRNQSAPTNYAPQFQQLPPPPPRNRAAEYAAWANTILATYGNIAALWQPGGPFYNQNQTDIINAAQWDTSNPFTQDYSNLAGRNRRARLAGPVPCGCIPHTNRYI